MNSDFMHQQAKLFAARLDSECKAPDCRIRAAYLHALARGPKPVELAMARRFFDGGGPLEDFCLALLNRNEFAYLP
jgi:hypothetical protein